MSRRVFMKSIGLAAATAIIPAKLRAADTKRPNIVVIYADDLGEKHDVASKHPEVVKELAGLLKKIKADGRTRP